MMSPIVAVVKQFSQKPQGRKTYLSDITIQAGNLVIGTRTIPGLWDEKQALKEYYRFPQRFKAPVA